MARREYARGLEELIDEVGSDDEARSGASRRGVEAEVAEDAADDRGRLDDGDEAHRPLAAWARQHVEREAAT